MPPAADSAPLPSPTPTATPAKHLTPTQVQVNDKVYDAAVLADMHPGGDLFVKAFAGRDATDAFLSYHRREFPHEKIAAETQGVLIGKVEGGEQRDAAGDREYLELCARVEKVLPRNKAFAPISYYIKALFMLGAALGLEYYQHSTAGYCWYLAVVQGVLFAWLGLNIQHDANHGAVSRRPWVNRLLGLSQNWIGGSALDWVHQHVVQHHIFSNDTMYDPDLSGNAILRINPLKPLTNIVAFQHIYVFCLFALFGVFYSVRSFMHLASGVHFTQMSVLVKNVRLFDQCWIPLFFLRWFLLPLYITGWQWSVLLNSILMMAVGGYYLSFFFIISHNFQGVAVNHHEAKNTDTNFLRRQVLTSSNVGGAWLCFINGGLNYQIEHHLFPRIQHTHYPLIAPVVRQFCQEKGITYVHFPTVTENVLSCVRHLYELGHQEYPSNFKGASSTTGGDAKGKKKN